MKKSVIAGLVAATVAVVSIPAVYAGFGGDEGCREGRMAKRHYDMGQYGPQGDRDGDAKSERQFERMAAHLNLTEEQKQSLTATREKNSEALSAAREKLEENRAAMRELTPAADDFISRSEALANEKAELQKEIALIRVSERKAFYDVLSEEQREQLASMGEGRHGFDGKGKPHRF